MNHCARILIGLSRILKRQPTADEYTAFVSELPQGEYMYIPDHNLKLSTEHVRATIMDKRRDGKTLRAIAREVDMSHERVRQIIADCQVFPPTELTET